jgi:hypothetical protein
MVPYMMKEQNELKSGYREEAEGSPIRSVFKSGAN